MENFDRHDSKGLALICEYTESHADGHFYSRNGGVRLFIGDARVCVEDNKTGKWVMRGRGITHMDFHTIMTAARAVKEKSGAPDPPKEYSRER